MKRYLISMMCAVSALFMLNGCIVSEQKLTDKVQESIVNAEKEEGNTLEVTDFSLNKQDGKNYTGVLKGRVNGEDAVYDVKVIDEGSDFDVDWEKRN